MKRISADHRRSQGGKKGPWTPKFLEHIIILCFKRRFSKQNSVIRLKSNILAPKFLGWPRHWCKCSYMLSRDLFVTCRCCAANSTAGVVTYGVAVVSSQRWQPANRHGKPTCIPTTWLWFLRSVKVIAMP